MIRKFRPYFKKYGRTRKIRKYLRKGYTSSRLANPINEFSRISAMSNIPTSCVSRIKASFT